VIILSDVTILRSDRHPRSSRATSLLMKAVSGSKIRLCKSFDVEYCAHNRHRNQDGQIGTQHKFEGGFHA
jgi:hypothetical protein